MLFLHLCWVSQAVHALGAEMNFWHQLPNGQEVPNCLSHWCPLPALQFLATNHFSHLFFLLPATPATTSAPQTCFLSLLPSGSCRIFCSLPKESAVGSFSFSSVHTWFILSMCWEMHWKVDVEKFMVLCSCARKEPTPDSNGTSSSTRFWLGKPL